MSSSSGFVFKDIPNRKFNKKNLEITKKDVQSLITVGEDRSFGNIFWLYQFRIFDTTKFVTFRKPWGHILELHVKAKTSLIF